MSRSKKDTTFEFLSRRLHQLEVERVELSKLLNQNRYANDFIKEDKHNLCRDENLKQCGRGDGDNPKSNSDDNNEYNDDAEHDFNDDYAESCLSDPLEIAVKDDLRELQKDLQKLKLNVNIEVDKILSRLERANTFCNELIKNKVSINPHFGIPRPFGGDD